MLDFWPLQCILEGYVEGMRNNGFYIIRDLPLFSAFSQEYREYTREDGVKLTCTLFKKVDLSSSITNLVECLLARICN